jgi:hypothetical protein
MLQIEFFGSMDEIVLAPTLGSPSSAAGKELPVQRRQLWLPARH